MECSSKTEIEDFWGIPKLTHTKREPKTESLLLYYCTTVLLHAANTTTVVQ